MKTVKWYQIEVKRINGQDTITKVCGEHYETYEDAEKSLLWILEEASICFQSLQYPFRVDYSTHEIIKGDYTDRYEVKEYSATLYEDDQEEITDIRIDALAERLMKVERKFDQWDFDESRTLEDYKMDIINNPTYVIEYLLDNIELGM